jgi:hypothetical protein
MIQLLKPDLTPLDTVTIIYFEAGQDSDSSRPSSKEGIRLLRRAFNRRNRCLEGGLSRLQ